MKAGFLIFVAALLTACASNTSGGKGVSAASMEIVRGMSYQQVLAVASDFEKQRTFKGRGTALQFCHGEFLGFDSFVVVWLVDDVVEGLTQYQIQRENAWRSCARQFREVDWGQAPANVKIKLDVE